MDCLNAEPHMLLTVMWIVFQGKGVIKLNDALQYLHDNPDVRAATLFCRMVNCHGLCSPYRRHSKRMCSACSVAP